jgi:XTP/dITP diphosphohydrolase
MTTMLIATRNAHKVGEIQAILGAEFRCLTLKEFPGVPAVVEDAETFAGNATKKAVELAKWLARAINGQLSTINYVLADDSGLEVDALNGAPGVHSARFAALDKNENSTDADNNAKLLRLLKDVQPEKRTARFRCVIALVSLQPPASSLKSSAALAQVAYNSPRAGWVALATTRCLCRTVFKKPSPNWARAKKIKSATAHRRLRS